MAQGQSDAHQVVDQDLKGMHDIRTTQLSGVDTKQDTGKTGDERKRDEVGQKIQGIFDATKTVVETKLKELDDKVNSTWDAKANSATDRFKADVEQKFKDYKDKRYGGVIGKGRWLKDQFMGLPEEANQLLEQARQTYIDDMDGVIDEVTTLIGTGLVAAKDRIAEGKKEIETYINGLPEDLKQVGEEAQEQIQTSFDELEHQVDDKQNELIDNLAQKYNENLAKIDEQIEKVKSENAGLIEKAAKAIGEMINVITTCIGQLMSALARAASAIPQIIKNPVKFLGNLINGVKQGFTNFGKNVGSHLKAGFIAFLTGAAPEANVKPPASNDAKGFFGMIASMAQITPEGFKQQLLQAYPAAASVIEEVAMAWDVLKIVQSQGLEGLWQFLAQHLGDLKTMIMEGVVQAIIPQVVMAGLRMLAAALGGPVGAFIKAVEMICQVAMFLFENAAQLAALVQAVTNSIVQIAAGNVGSAAAAIEQSLAAAIPLTLSFLATLIGVRVGDKIAKVLKGFVTKAKGAVKGLMKKAKPVIDKLLKKRKDKAKPQPGAKPGGNRPDAKKPDTKKDSEKKDDGQDADGNRSSSADNTKKDHDGDDAGGPGRKPHRDGDGDGDGPGRKPHRDGDGDGGGPGRKPRRDGDDDPNKKPKDKDDPDKDKDKKPLDLGPKELFPNVTVKVSFSMEGEGHSVTFKAQGKDVDGTLASVPGDIEKKVRAAKSEVRDWPNTHEFSDEKADVLRRLDEIKDETDDTRINQRWATKARQFDQSAHAQRVTRTSEAREKAKWARRIRGAREAELKKVADKARDDLRALGAKYKIQSIEDLDFEVPEKRYLPPSFGGLGAPPSDTGRPKYPQSVIRQKLYEHGNWETARQGAIDVGIKEITSQLTPALGQYKANPSAANRKALVDQVEDMVADGLLPDLFDHETRTWADIKTELEKKRDARDKRKLTKDPNAKLSEIKQEGVQSGRTPHTDALLSDPASYLHQLANARNPQYFDVDHDRPLVEHWTDKGYDAQDMERWSVVDNPHNLKLRSSAWNRRKSGGINAAGEKRMYREKPYVGRGFRSSQAEGNSKNALQIGGQAFRRSEGGPELKLEDFLPKSTSVRQKR